MTVNAVAGPHGGGSIAPAGPGEQVSLSDVSFSDVLRALNPLQYLPVIGTIYRAATGDAAPGGLREAVSAVAGLLTGGPVGLFGSIAGSLLEDFFHVDDRVRLAFAPAPPSASINAAGTTVAPTVDAGTPATAPVRVAAAYRAAGLLGAV